MNTIKARIYTDPAYSNNYYNQQFDIIDELPKIGGELYDDEVLKIEQVYPSDLNEEGEKYDFYEIELRDSREDEEDNVGDYLTHVAIFREGYIEL